MKIYRIKVGTCAYVKYVMLGGNPSIQCEITFGEKEAAWYEEDKAKVYCEELNKTVNDILFELECVGYSDYGKI